MLAVFMMATGCRVTEKDIERWATRASGPKRLVAVVQHDKYSRPLRVDAALTLITMPRRGGQPVGLQGGEQTKGLLQALKEMPPSQRTPIVSSLVEPLEEGMALKPGESRDPSIPYKDAAYALLTYDGGSLVDDSTARERLRQALTQWTQVEFARRLDDSSQLYGMEQVIRLLGDEVLGGLTPLIEPNFEKLRELSRFISEYGSEETRKDASKRLVRVARYVGSEQWIEAQRPQVKKANAASDLDVSEKQLEKQLNTYQKEELSRVFGAMKAIGQQPATEFLIEFASDPSKEEQRRAAALAALEGNLDPESTAHAEAMLSLLENDETPDKLRDLATRRLRELSRSLVAPRLYELFSHERWKLRWIVASLLLEMSEAQHIEEFMSKLGNVRRMAMTEALTYGPLLADIEGIEPAELALEYAQPHHPPSVRVTALGYFYKHGSAKQIARLEPFRNDRTPVPACPRTPDGQKTSEECSWSCTVVEDGEQKRKEISMMSEFVDDCLIFAMKSRADEASNAKEAQTDTETPRGKK